METIAKVITEFLVCKKCITTEEKAICQYGYEVILSTVVGYTIVLLLSMICGDVKEGIVFLLIFVPTRMYTGGYHANSYLICNICLASVYLIYVGLVYILGHSSGSMVFLLLMLTVYWVSIVWFAPVENSNKKLTEKKVRKAQLVSKILMIIWSALGVGLVLLHSKTGIMIIVTVFLVAILMIIEVYGKDTVSK